MRIKWDEDTKRYYETGTSHGVLYPKSSEGGYETGVPWNGLTAVSESPSGGDETELWANDSKYGSLRAAEKFGATIEAYTYPEEFEECDGSLAIATGVTIGQQPRKGFGFTYQTVIGNDVSTEAGFKLHIIYNASASPSEKSYQSINDSPEAITFSWEVSTTASEITVNGEVKKTANITIDSTKLKGGKKNANLVALMDLLYGVDGEGSTGKEPSLPTPDEVYALMNKAVSADGTAAA